MEKSLLNRHTRFAYVCNRCMSCCRDAHIALDPYELARLARNRRLNTGEFIAQYLHEGGIVLRKREDSSCIMLDSHGCGAYSDRPQICRTYPLKRVQNNGVEIFLRYSQLPTSTGEYIGEGTIAEFLHAHGAAEYFAAKDRYGELAIRIVTVLAEIARRIPQWFGAIRDRMDAHCAFRITTTPALVDVDRVVSDYCIERRLEAPIAIEQKISMHIRAIEEQLESIATISAVDLVGKRDVIEMAEFVGALGAATEIRVTLVFVAAAFGQKIGSANLPNPVAGR
jgi:Fe-S-cluster containining protein